MKPKGGLGRGLGALIPTSLSSGSVEVEIEDLTPNPSQPRQRHDQSTLESLAESIREHGLLQPLVVTQSSDPGPAYQIIAGERRWRAAKLAGLARVPVVIRDVTPQQLLELALVENIQRSDLNPLEEAEAYRHLSADFGLTQERIAESVGRSRVAVANALRLLRLSQPVKDALWAGEISEGHAHALFPLEGDEDQAKALELVRAGGLSVRQTEELARKLLGRIAVEPALAPQAEVSDDPNLESLEDEFRRALGTKVVLHRGKRGGHLVVYYYSDEELDGLYRSIVHP